MGIAAAISKGGGKVMENGFGFPPLLIRLVISIALMYFFGSRWKSFCLPPESASAADMEPLAEADEAHDTLKRLDHTAPFRA